MRALRKCLVFLPVLISGFYGPSFASTPYIVATDFPGSPDIGAQVNNAIASLGASGGTVYIPPGNYTFSQTIHYSSVSAAGSQGGGNITLLGGGRNSTILNYTGAGHAIACTAAGLSGSPASGALSDFTLVGTGAAGTVGIYIQSCTGEHLDRLSVQNFGAAGIELDNINTATGPGWTERTYLGDIVAANAGPDVWFHVNGGTNSFGYTTIVGAHLDGQALLVDSGAALYGSFIQFNSNSSGVEMIDVRGSLFGCFIDINAENTAGSPSSYSVYVESGGSFVAQGMLRAESMQVQNNGTFYLYGQGYHSDPASSSAGLYPGDKYTRPVAADDQVYPAALLAMSGNYNNGTGNALVMTAPYSDGRGGLRVLNGLTATSPAVASLDNSGVLTLKTTAYPSNAPAGAVGFTSLTGTSASAGAHGAAPTQVAGYLIVNIGGTNYKIPYYNN